jgi:hypothetical protein
MEIILLVVGSTLCIGLWFWWIGRGEFRHLVKALPLDPYEPRYEWQAILLRYFRYLRRSVAVVLVAMLSASVAVDLSTTPANDLGHWISDNLVVVEVMAGILWFALVTEASISFYRIIKRDPHDYRERSLFECLVLGQGLMFLMLLMVLSWIGLATGSRIY